MPIRLASLYDNEIIGFCNIRLNALNHYECNYPFICGLYICEEFRNKGYGTLLIKCAIDKIKKMGYTKVYLWTEEIPEYYERLGFHYIKDILKNDMIHTKLNFPNELGTSSNYDIEYDKEKRALTEGRRINSNTFRFF